MSDLGLRRAAWAAWWFFAASFTLAGVLTQSEQPGWGTAEFPGEVGFLLVVMTFPLTGLLIVRRQPRNTIGWVLIAIGLIWGLSALADGYVTYGLLVSPGSLPGPGVVAALAASSWAPGIGMMGTFLILLFPDGHLPSPQWRPVAWVSAVAIVAVYVIICLSPGELGVGPAPTMQNPIAVESARSLLHILLAGFLTLFTLSIVACAVALVVRFRRSSGTERLQLKWLAAAAALVALLYLLTMASGLVTGAASPNPEPRWVIALQTASILSFFLLPAAIGAAILRHRLYDIDVVVKRALVYGTLTASLLATYLVLVLLLQGALTPVTRESDLAVAASTLAVAALFRPLRSRIQTAVDRRFFRGRYDAGRTLVAFSDRLRQEVDLDSVGSHLHTAVSETVQPVHVTLWLRPQG